MHMELQDIRDDMTDINIDRDAIQTKIEQLKQQKANLESAYRYKFEKATELKNKIANHRLDNTVQAKQSES